MSFIVAIDGPAGSGKTTISKLIANSLGLTRIDSGAMYRCVAYEMIKRNISLDNISQILNILNDIEITFNGETVILNGQDVTNAIRTKEVAEHVSPVSAIKEVRARLVEMQRKFAEEKNIVMEGRDIGTTVFPNANVKIYLDASVEERAKRRFSENVQRNINMTYEEVKNNIIDRDKRDSSREASPMRIPDDAVIVDTSNLTLEQVKEKIEEIVKKKI